MLPHYRRRKDLKDPHDHFDAIRCRLSSATDAEKALLRAEIAERYAAQAKRWHKANPLRLMTIVRLYDLERLILDSYGVYLPDDDAGWDDFKIVAHHLAHLDAVVAERIARIVDWAAIWAPTFPTGKVIEHAKRIAANPQRWKADTLAWRLWLTMERRTQLKIGSIGAIDVRKADRPAWLREYHRKRREAERRANGAKPRAEYLAGSTSAQKPWAALGMSRAKWYRLGKPELETKSARETSPPDYKVRLRADGLVSPTTTDGGSDTLAKGKPGQPRQSSPHRKHQVAPTAMATPLQQEKLVEGSPTARHLAASECSQPIVDHAMVRPDHVMMRLPTVPIMSRADMIRAGFLLAVTPITAPMWLRTAAGGSQ
jgi:hypothetical protein